MFCYVHNRKDPSIAACVLDSPFSSLRKVAEETPATYPRQRQSKGNEQAISNRQWAIYIYIYREREREIDREREREIEI